MDTYMYNSYIQVDLDQIVRNAETIAASLPAGTRLIPVLKDDAYGLGLEAVGRTLAAMPQVELLAVAQVSEGAALRAAGVDKDILVMGGVPSFQLPAAVELGLTVSTGRLGLVPELARHAARMGTTARVHIKVETGLHRTGLFPGRELERLMDELSAAGDLVRVTGAFSHFADLEDAPRAAQQYRDFLSGVEQLRAGGVSIPLRHIAASEASEFYPEYVLDGVRVGRRLFMDHPTRPLGSIREVCSWRTFVTNVRPLRAGDPVGYGGRFHLDHDGVVATIGVGYGDGLSEELCRVHGPVLVGGRRCPLLACCMDQSFVEVTGLSCRPDDEVTLFGSDGRGNFISSQEVALLAGAQEGCGLTSALGRRVARICSGGADS